MSARATGSPSRRAGVTAMTYLNVDEVESATALAAGRRQRRLHRADHAARIRPGRAGPVAPSASTRDPSRPAAGCTSWAGSTPGNGAAPTSWSTSSGCSPTPTAPTPGSPRAGCPSPPRTSRRIVTTLDVVVFPQANPDGRHHSMTVDPMWRKNRRPGRPGGRGLRRRRRQRARRRHQPQLRLPVGLPHQVQRRRPR